MKAYIYKTTQETNQKILGSEFVTRDYQTVKGLLRWALKPCEKGQYQVEIYLNWANRYGKPDLIKKVSI